MTTFRVYIKYLFIFILIGIALIVTSNFISGSFCIFYRFLGIPCPTCGITRAVKYLLVGDFYNAFYFHPLFPLLIFFPLFFTKKGEKCIYIIGSIFIIVWILRMFFLFPNTPPMNINEDAILIKVITYIFN